MNDFEAATFEVAGGAYGLPTPVTVWQVPESVHIIHLSDAPASHLLDGAVLAWWVE